MPVGETPESYNGDCLVAAEYTLMNRADHRGGSNTRVEEAVASQDAGARGGKVYARRRVDGPRKERETPARSGLLRAGFSWAEWVGDG